ncbi:MULTISPECIES: nucleotidyltransferase and HEPN domain-containing protein [unclassified Mesorhizobium]|uniref:nucleotidyltransferase and HEPN domain-containing protein n=1 Tax=unclassified Mesorhizobium TaxID=325217 RepID=UPI00112E3B6A|nr:MULTISPECIES: nucleotidyltransferase and HEPN domain-containing protein [unclassified Mesorhizobium]MBZ9894657.1 nucleotidyltransferase and HEPN domain-containing protein [Mesorhizobium sp. BR1-1-6]TPN30471.1 nucleotidyltransferase [Mesorhizobium sp. B1-1-6]
MKTSIDHLPEHKQAELARVIEILHAEFEDALAESSADWKKSGRILKIILFGSYARGDWVDEPLTMKGYRSDFDLLVVVNNNKLSDFAYWYKAKDRLERDRAIKTPTSFIVHSRRFVNTALHQGQYFFTDIRREGIVLYELDSEPLAEPQALTPQAAYQRAEENFQNRLPGVKQWLETFAFQLDRSRIDGGWRKAAAFTLHQSIEHIYATLLLVLTNYSPPSHKLTFLRALAEDQDRRLSEAWPREQQRHRAWFNTLNEAYVKARYSNHYLISEEALVWLGERTAELHKCAELVCLQHLRRMREAAGP